MVDFEVTLCPPEEPSPEEPPRPLMTELEVFKARAFSAEAAMANFRVATLIAERKAFLRKVDPENRLGGYDEEIGAMASLASVRKLAFNATMAAAATRYGLNPERCTWDDETGLLRQLED